LLQPPRPRQLSRSRLRRLRRRRPRRQRLHRRGFGHLPRRLSRELTRLRPRPHPSRRPSRPSLSPLPRRHQPWHQGRPPRQSARTRAPSTIAS